MDTTQLFYAASKKLQLYEGKKKVSSTPEVVTRFYVLYV
jgi:hypothetical protein